MKHKNCFLSIFTLLLAAILLNTVSAVNVTADDVDTSEKRNIKNELKDIQRKGRAERKELKINHKEEKKALKKEWKELRKSEGGLSDSKKEEMREKFESLRERHKEERNALKAKWQKIASEKGLKRTQRNVKWEGMSDEEWAAKRENSKGNAEERWQKKKENWQNENKAGSETGSHDNEGSNDNEGSDD